MNYLAKWEKAKQAIAECKTIDEAKEIRDKAEALRAYARQAKESLEVQNYFAEITLRADRRIGQFFLYKKQELENHIANSRKYIAQNRTEILKALGKECFVCGLDKIFLLQIHHIKSLTSNGTNDLDNLLCLCPNCHFVVHNYLSQHEKLKNDKSLFMDSLEYFLQYFTSESVLVEKIGKINGGIK